ncbi:hypothetical protein [Pseudonocardia sp.]|uniref:hypothetical protein n=1 Tax=Pseudonocardia sp. TaxID=60912 RepID=UPI0026373262|nr:hypothetical protein [Pseudonocardia sp.]
MTTTGKHLHDARHPAERYAAIFLAIAQRDLGLARASSPEILAAEDPENPDPVAEYAAWVERMVESERFHRLAALRSVEACRRDDDSPDPGRALLDPADGPEFADSVRRARAAIAAMLGPDPVAARAAQHDVLVRWYADDDVHGGSSSC